MDESIEQAIASWKLVLLQRMELRKAEMAHKKLINRMSGPAQAWYREGIRNLLAGINPEEEGE